jgi:predicted Zn-ribbon and HTH transcriptional regulator
MSGIGVRKGKAVLHPALAMLRKDAEKREHARNVPTFVCYTCGELTFSEKIIAARCPKCVTAFEALRVEQRRRRDMEREVLAKEKAIQESFMVKPHRHSDWYGLFSTYDEVYDLLVRVYGDGDDDVPQSIEIEKRGWLGFALLPAEQLEADLRRGNIYLPPTKTQLRPAPATAKARNKLESYEKHLESLHNV